MKKIDLFALFILALGIYSINFIFQKYPGYLDAEYYYLGGKQLVEGKVSLNVIWNYLDDPSGLPHPLFSYWMPLASLLAGFSMKIFGITFQGSRIIFLLLAAGLAPFSYFVSYKISQNRFVSIVTGLLAIFTGFYFKFLTIPETILPVMYLGGIFFYLIGKLFTTSIIRYKTFVILGIISGLLHLARADGIIFIVLAILSFILLWNKKGKNFDFKFKFWSLVILIGLYLITISGFLIYNSIQFGSIFSPANSRAIWIATYDDTFTFPAANLTFQYFVENGLPLRGAQIWNALKQNLNSLVGVQFLIVGLPLFVVGLWKRKDNPVIRIAIIHLIIVFLLMSFIFPLAGSRGGFLHSCSANQVVVWFLIAEGLQGFIEWGIKKRNWKLHRSQIMFGSALIMVALFITGFVYIKDVIGEYDEEFLWNQEYKTYETIETIILTKSQDKSEVIMINNPVGYYYKTGRSSVVIPNAEPNQLLSVMNLMDVEYLVLDKNLPDRFSAEHIDMIETHFDLINEENSMVKIYEKK